MIRRVETGDIVVPWNFSKNSRIALEKAFEESGESTPIRVLHVVSPLSGPDNGALYQFAEKQKIRELEQRFRRELSEDDRLRNIRFHVEYGYVGQTIARFAKQFQAELIVMATRERTGLSKFLFGSLGKRVVRLSACPVLVLPGERQNIGEQSKFLAERGGTKDRTVQHRKACNNQGRGE